MEDEANIQKLSPESSEGLKSVNLFGAFRAFQESYTPFQGTATVDEITGRVMGTITDRYGISNILGIVQSGSFLFSKLYKGSINPIDHESYLDQDLDWIGQYTGCVQTGMGEIIPFQGGFFCKGFTDADATNDNVSLIRAGFNRDYKANEKLISENRKIIVQKTRAHLLPPTSGTRPN